MKQQVFFQLRELETILKPYKGEKIFLVTGRSSYDRYIRALVKPFIQHFEITRFSDFEVNPSIEDARKGVTLYDSHRLIIAIGGGSVIDMAKLIKGAQERSRETSLLDIYTNKASVREGVPLVAIPTTAGSGSESTRFAVVYINRKKHSFESIYIKPDRVIIDPVMSRSMPPNVTAVTGFDALSQAVEAFWSVNSTPESSCYATEAIELILPVIEKAVNAPDHHSRKNMARGSWLAGKAIDITKTTAPHAMSYFLTQHYGLPHGHGVALFLGRYFSINSPDSVHPRIKAESNLQITDPRGTEYLKRNMARLFSLFGVHSAKECEDRWFRLMKACNLESDLRKVGINTSVDVDTFFDSINEHRLKNNPVMVDFGYLKRLWFSGL